MENLALKTAPFQLIFRTDADRLMGTGHVMRCLALAEAWQAEGGQATFVSACGSDLRQRIEESGCELVKVGRAYPDQDDLETTLDYLAGLSGSVLVLDGYHFDETYQKELKRAGHSLAVIDDFQHADHYVADVVLNQNLGADQLDYSREPYTRLLLGPRYALLRSEFTQWRGWERSVDDCARRLLVTLGGSDPHNVTCLVLEALGRLKEPNLEAVVVVGGSNPYLDELEQAIQACTGSVRLERNVSDMARLMAWADLAVSGGGITCWELAFMGLPNVIIVLAENQCAVAEPLEQAGVSAYVGRAPEIAAADLEAAMEGLIHDGATRREMSAQGRALVDGLGCQRVLAALRDLGTPHAIEP